MASAASGLEQNHLSPLSSQRFGSLGSGRASVAVAAMSEPAPCSVMNIAPWASVSRSRLVRLSK